MGFLAWLWRTPSSGSRGPSPVPSEAGAPAGSRPLAGQRPAARRSALLLFSDLTVVLQCLRSADLVPQDLVAVGAVNYGWVIVKWSMGPPPDVDRPPQLDDRAESQAGVAAENGQPTESGKVSSDELARVPSDEFARLPSDEFARLPSKSRKFLRSVSKTLSVASTTLIGIEVDAHERPRYTRCQVMLDGTPHGASREIRWDKEKRMHVFSVSVEVGQASHRRKDRSVAVRVLDTCTNDWTAWSESLAVDLNGAPANKETRPPKPKKLLHPDLPMDFYRSKLRWRKTVGANPAANDVQIARSRSAPDDIAHGRHFTKDSLGKISTAAPSNSIPPFGANFSMRCLTIAPKSTSDFLRAGAYNPKFITWRSSKIQPLSIPECEPELERDIQNISSGSTSEVSRRS